VLTIHHLSNASCSCLRSHIKASARTVSSL
jgi:hypothetical protein